MRNLSVGSCSFQSGDHPHLPTARAPSTAMRLCRVAWLEEEDILYNR